MTVSRSEQSRKIERAIQKKYPKNELDIGISAYEQTKLSKKIREKLDQEHAASAMILAKEYLSKYSKNVNILKDLGQSYAWLCRYEEAISTFNNSLKICHKDDRHYIYHWLAFMYENKSDLESAENYYKKTIQYCSEPTEALFEAGVFFLRHGRQEEAEKHLHHYVYYLLAEIYYKKGNLKQAESFYIKASKKNALYKGALGVFYGECGRLDEAEICYRETLKIQTKSIEEAYYNLGFVQMAKERYEEARLSFSKAIEISPDNDIEYQISLDDVNYVLQRLGKVN